MTKTRLKRFKLAALALTAMLGVGVLALVPTAVYAASSAASEVQAGCAATGGDCSQGTGGITGIVGTVVKTMLFFVGVLAVIMIIFSGIRYITAHGDQAQVKAATNTLIYSVVGLVVAILAYAIVSFVVGVVG